MDEDAEVMTEEQYDDLLDELSGHEMESKRGRTIYDNPGIECLNPRCPHGAFDALIVSDVGWMEFGTRAALTMCMCVVDTEEGQKKLIFLHEPE